jgi:hypothetical protein
MSTAKEAEKISRALTRQHYHARRVSGVWIKRGQYLQGWKVRCMANVIGTFLWWTTTSEAPLHHGKLQLRLTFHMPVPTRPQSQISKWSFPEVPW